MNNQIIEWRKIKVSYQKLPKGVKCPFCGIDNYKARCIHLYTINEPKIRSLITDTLIGDFTYVFKK